MEELAIVRKRSRVWQILLVAIVLAVIAIAVLYVIGSGGVSNLGITLGAVEAPVTGGIHGIA